MATRRNPNPEIAHRILVQVAIRVIEKQKQAERQAKKDKVSEPEDSGCAILGLAVLCKGEAALFILGIFAITSSFWLGGVYAKQQKCTHETFQIRPFQRLG
jgi:hypothetical protein